MAITISLELCSSVLRTKSRFYFIFNWRIIALQCYVCFCRITTHISHNYIYMCVCVCVCVCVCILSLLSGHPVRSPSHPSRSSPGWALCVAQWCPLAVCFIHGDICTSMLLSRFLPPSPSPTVSPSPRSMILN